MVMNKFLPLDKCKCIAYTTCNCIALFMTSLVKHDCKRELNRLSLRATPARVSILSLLELTNEPIDVATILAHLRKQNVATDPATVFRIMNTFTQKGITATIEFQEGKARYELASKEDHHHLICENCGKVEDVEDKVIPALQKHIQKKHDFIVKRHSLEFFGRCGNCQK